MNESASPRDSSPVRIGEEMHLIDVMIVIAENLRLLIYGPLLFGLAAFAFTFTMKPTFTASTIIIPPQQQQNTMALLASQLGGLVAGGAGISGIRGAPLTNPSDVYVTLIKSRTVSDEIIGDFNLTQLYGGKLKDEARAILEVNTKVTAGKDGLITIEVKDHDPKRAADMANAYVQHFTQLIGRLAITEAQQRRAFFEKQFLTTNENLARAQLALGEVGVPESLMKSSPATVLENIARLRAQVTAQEIKVSTMRGYLTEQSPDFKQAQLELSALKAQLARTEEAQAPRGKNNAEYLNRFRDFKYQETLLELLAKQLESARLDESREGALVQVVDTALPPKVRSSPKRKEITVVSAIASGILLLLAVFAHEAWRGARNNPESANKLARILSGLWRVVAWKVK